MVLLPIAVLLVFAPALDTYFAQDDFSFLARAQSATLDGLLAHFVRFGGEFYRPLTELYFALLVRLFDLNAVAFHSVSIVLLAVNSILVAKLCAKLGIGHRGQVAASAFYGCHSAFLVLAIWSAAANSLIAVFWSLITILLILGEHRRRTLLALLTFVLAMASREVSAVVPLLALLCRWMELRACTRGGKLGLVANLAAKPALLMLPLALYALLRYGGVARLAAGSAYGVDMGWHVLYNVVNLAALAPGLSIGAEQIVGNFAGLAYRAAFWLAMVVAAIVLLQRGRPISFFGLLWFAAAIAPVVLLSSHPMDAYYLDLALVGVAISLADIVELGLNHLSVSRARLTAAVALVLYLMMSAVSVRAELHRSPVRGQAMRAQRLVSDVMGVYASLPRGSTLLLEDTDDVTNWAIGFGDLYRVVYREPTLRVIIASRGDRLDVETARYGELFVFQMQGEHLVDVTASKRQGDLQSVGVAL